MAKKKIRQGFFCVDCQKYSFEPDHPYICSCGNSFALQDSRCKGCGCIECQCLLQTDLTDFTKGGDLK